ncbi:hypothetical protein HC891_22510 [Candidatus Gracilibacteria bacterium]|nr:hypothetical protein [Candidatus Gracilibacteria bacterium]
MVLTRTTRLLMLVFGLILALSTLPSRASERSTVVYLPLVQNAPANNVFGLEMVAISEQRGFSAALELQPSWIRRNGLRWSDVEPLENGGYNWSHRRVLALEKEMIIASKRGIDLILIVRASPRWATKPYQADCAPINAAHYDDFARFMTAAVDRYSRPPYNVRYWELGNEPDAFVFPGDSVFGCWGLVDDEYYGGRQYGAMLNVVYPAMKAANPKIQVLNGGLLLDREYDPATGEGLSGRFFEGMLVAGAGNSFDILSYHDYVPYNVVRGPPNSWKPRYLRRIMEQFAVNKPLMNTEGALLCNEDSLACRTAQAYAVGRLYARAARDNLLGHIWYIYDSDGFRHTALIDTNDFSTLRPAYIAFHYTSNRLASAQFIGPITGQRLSVEGYRFQRGREEVVIVWSDSNAQATITVPEGAQPACTEWDGTSFACTANEGQLTLSVGMAPRYVTFARLEPASCDLTTYPTQEGCS